MIFFNYKSDISHFASFSRYCFPVVSPQLCLPFLSPLGVSPLCLPCCTSPFWGPSPRAGFPPTRARARALNARAHPLAESPTRGLGPQNGEAQQGRHNGETQTPKTSHINAVPRRQKATPRPDPLLFLGGPACRSPGIRSQQASQGHIHGFLWASKLAVCQPLNP